MTKNYRKHLILTIILILALSLLFYLLKNSFFSTSNINKSNINNISSDFNSNNSNNKIAVNSLNENDIQIFVINLKRSEERWNAINNQLQENGLVFQRFDAVDGYLLNIVNNKGEKFSGLDLKNNPSLIKPNNYYTINCPSEKIKYYSNFAEVPRALTSGEFGVYCSHREIWLKMIKEHIPYALILEDDALLKENFRKQFLTNIKKLPKDWNILYLHMIYYSDGFKNFSTVENNIYLKKITKNIRFTTATAYLVDLATAKLLVKNSKNFTWPIDHVMEFTIRGNNLGAYAITPFPVMTRGGSAIAEMFPSANDSRN